MPAKDIFHAERRFASNPTPEHLSQIKTWLEDEKEESGHSFICNWGVIESSFGRNELFVATNQDDFAIAFLAWDEHTESLINLNIAVVHPAYRENGVAKFLIYKSFELFRDNGCLVAELECQPPTSEPVWRKLNFQDFPQQVQSEESWRSWRKSTYLYRPLITAAKVNKRQETNNLIELWDKDPYLAKHLPSTWSWYISFNEDYELTEPIIFPCDPNWRLRWTQNGETLLDKKVKYFLDYTQETFEYLLITELPHIGVS